MKYWKAFMEWLGKNRRLSGAVCLAVLVVVLWFINAYIVLPCCNILIRDSLATDNNAPVCKCETYSAPLLDKSECCKSDVRKEDKTDKNQIIYHCHYKVYYHILAYIVTVFVIADLLLVLVPFWCVYHKQDD